MHARTHMRTHTQTRIGPILLLGAGLALAVGASCLPSAKLFVDSPVQGSFLNGTSVTVEGRLNLPASFTSLTVNGVATTPAATWSVQVPVDPAAVFNRLTVQGTLQSGAVLRKSVVVVVGDGVTTGFVADGAASPAAIGMRLSDTGLDQITPIVESLSGDSLDISSIITDQNPIAQGSMSGINYTANVVEVGFGGFGLDVDPTSGGLDTTIADRRLLPRDRPRSRLARRLHARDRDGDRGDRRLLRSPAARFGRVVRGREPGVARDGDARRIRLPASCRASATTR